MGKDTVTVAGSQPAACVLPPNASGPIIVSSGNPPGTLKMIYTVVGTQFPTGYFTCFDLAVSNQDQGTNNDPNYTGLLLYLTQNPNPSLSLNISPSQFSVPQPPANGSVAVGTSRVGITIPQVDPSLNYDGSELVAQIQLTTNEQNKKLGTPSTILVKIILSVPESTACINAYHEVYTNDTDTKVSGDGTGIAIETQTKTTGGPNGQTTTTMKQPQPGNIREAVLVVNTCGESQNLDVSIGEPERLTDNTTVSYKLQSNGNAVFYYVPAGLTSLGNALVLPLVSTPNGLSTCVAGITLAPNQAVLVTAHRVDQLKDKDPALLPGDGGFDFHASVLQQALSACTGALHPLVSPNPLNTTADFTVTAQQNLR